MDDIVGTPDWSQIPPPVDDGGTVDLSVCRGRTVIYIYRGLAGRASQPWRMGHDPRRPRVLAAVVRVQGPLR